MKPAIFLTLAALVAPLQADPQQLSPLDAQLLLERLKELREGSDKRIKESYQSAFGAFRAAIQSDAAAHDLYLKCVEKVRFEDEKKSGQDFRDWKRRHKDNGDTPAFRRALRHQLNWLLLTLEAASEPKKRDELGAKAMERIDLIFKDAEDLAGSESLLRQGVLQTVFATAYGVNDIDLEGWPTAPLQLSAVYEQLILPPLRKPAKLAELKQAWERRILHEGSVHNLWGKPSNGRGGGEGRPLELEKFLAERRPQMEWDMEVDLFRAGDQKGAALRMLKHIEEHVTHRNASDWIENFEMMVKGQMAPAPPSAPPAEAATEPSGEEGGPASAGSQPAAP